MYGHYLLGRKLHQRTTSTAKIVISANGKHCSGGDHVPHSGPAKWRILRRQRYFSTVPRRKNTGLVHLHSTVLALPPRPNQLLRAHTRTTPAALKRSAPNGVCHVVGEFMTYSCLHQKLKNDHSYCTSGCETAVHWSTCLVYLDDLIIYSRNPEEHFKRLQEVMERLHTAGLKLKPSKCYLFQKSVHYLGHIISKHGVENDPQKIQCVNEWPIQLALRKCNNSWV